MGRLQRPCYQCRCRKVRCDRQADTCKNCARLEFKCSFSNVALTPSQSAQADRRPERQRGSQACIECRRQKSRCSGEMPECASCVRRQRRCQYPKESGISNEKSLPISPEDISLGIDGYFEHLYPLPSYAFLHEQTVRQQNHESALEPTLALSIAAVVKLLLSNQDQSDLVTRAEAMVWEHIERPSIVKLQSLLLIIHYHIHKGQFARAYMLAGLAARGATALRLNYERPELDPIAQETRRRVLWALTFIDGQFSVGLPEYETIPHTIIYQQLPLSEDTFNGSPQKETQLSLLGGCVRISKIQKDIMRLTRQLALSEQPFTQLNGLVLEIQRDLWRLQAEIEISCGYSVCRPYELEKSRWFPRYLQISISWHQAHCDLYRLFLVGYPEAAPRIILEAIDADVKDHAARQCLEHVTQANEMFFGLLDIPKLVLPHYIAICAYQTTRLMLFLSSSPDLSLELSMAEVVQKAHAVVAVTHKYFSSPSTKELVLDLQRIVQVAKDDPRMIYSELCHSPSDQGVHRHNHLAIHSLVRQAHFADDGYGDIDSLERQSRPGQATQ